MKLFQGVVSYFNLVLQKKNCRVLWEIDVHYKINKWTINFTAKQPKIHAKLLYTLTLLAHQDEVLTGAYTTANGDLVFSCNPVMVL